MLIDNFGQQFEKYAQNTRNAWKSAQNQINSLSTVPTEMTLWRFSVVSGFSNMLYGKKRKPGNAGNQQSSSSSNSFFILGNNSLKLAIYITRNYNNLH